MGSKCLLGKHDECLGITCQRFSHPGALLAEHEQKNQQKEFANNINNLLKPLHRHTLLRDSNKLCEEHFQYAKIENIFIQSEKVPPNFELNW